MAVTYDFPTNATLTAVAQDYLPVLTMDDPIHKLIPFKNVESHIVEWEQYDNFLGLMGIRGVNGPPAVVKPVGLRRFVMEPGVYGDVSMLDEKQLLTRRRMGTFGDRVNVTDMVLLLQKQQMTRYVDRIRWIGWTLLSAGTFSVANAQGAILHADTYSIQSYSAGVNWSTSATAAPLGDLRSAALLHRGHSVDFSRATAYMNMVTYNRMISNINPADLYGRRNVGLSTINNVDEFNKLVTGDGLPGIVIHDEGYMDSTNTFQPFIPNNRVIIVGRRKDNAPIGEFQLTLNTNNPNDEPGMYAKVVDYGEQRVPRTIEVHSGFNGGPALFFPSAVVVMSVGTLGA